MTLILSNDDVAELLPMRECIDALEDAYIELSEGRGVSRVRSDCLVPATQGDAIYSLKSMDGVVPNLGVGAVRIDSDIVTWPTSGGDMRRVKVQAAAGRRYVGLVLLFSTENGEPLAIFPDGVMQRIRVGATNGLGVKYLARKDAKSVGILGSGWQAGTQLTAVWTVRKIETMCFSPNRDCAAFAKEMESVFGIAVVPVATAEEAIGSADIVMCATNSLTPVFFARWIAPGMHLSAIKLPEIDATAVARADRLVIHTQDAKPMHVTAKGLAVPETGEGKGWAAGRAIDFHRVPTLPDLIAGKAAGRGEDREVTCFINNLGLGYQFAAAGAVVYRNAKRRGRGRELPTEWLTQDVHP
jgi:ornithine cyclodeaminase/alanine dehydrogenase-like protein (mu-crystallin family)